MAQMTPSLPASAVLGKGWMNWATAKSPFLLSDRKTISA